MLKVNNKYNETRCEISLKFNNKNNIMYVVLESLLLTQSKFQRLLQFFIFNFEPVGSTPNSTFSFKNYVRNFDSSNETNELVPVVLFFFRNSASSNFVSNQ